jgi:transposase
MMGSKERHFAPLIQISLEELVPQDHFYRHLEQTLDLSFVREFVQEAYACKGRPSIDPVVFFKLQLVMFFQGIRSERQLMRQAADRLSVRWYIGYDLDEPLPDHSCLTRIRERYRVEVFRHFGGHHILSAYPTANRSLRTRARGADSRECRPARLDRRAGQAPARRAWPLPPHG